MLTHWIRSAVGLETLAANEFIAKFGGSIKQLSHRSALVSFEAEIKINPHSLRMADDIYTYYGPVSNIDHTKSSLQHLKQWAADFLIDPIEKLSAKYIRTTVSFLGSRNYNRFFVESILNQVIQEHVEVTILSNEQSETWKSNETRIRVHIEDSLAHIGIALFDKPIHRRDWRTESYEGQLHPPVASAIASYISKPVSCVVDPFCGSGTLLIESLNYGDPNIPRIGYDINPEAIEIAKRNVERNGINVLIEQKDFSLLSENISNFGIISNPPWGKKFKPDSPELDNFYASLYPILIQAEWSILLMPESFAEWMLHNSLKFETLFITRIRGQVVHAYKIK